MDNQNRFRMAVFASGSGTNFEAIVQAGKAGELDAEIGLLICDKPDAYVIERAKQFSIPFVMLEPKQFPDKAAYEEAILIQLNQENIDLIVLAGYMRIIGQTLLQAYPNRILNIHPSLLPLYPGRQGIADAYKDGAAETGVTVHLVDQGIDTGPILAQEKITVESSDTLETLEEKIHTLEHMMYPRVIEFYIEKLKKEQVRT